MVWYWKGEEPMLGSEKGEISIHEARLYKTFVLSPETWFSNREAAKLAEISERTARMHTLRLVKLGILDLAEVYPGHRFRLSKMADKRNKSYMQRLDNVCEIFGMK